MKILTILVMTLFILSLQAAVVKEDLGNCTNYSILNKVESATGERVLPILRTGQELINKNKEHYGLHIRNLEIDFINKQASAKVVQAIVLGFNRSLLSERVSISSTHPNFTQFINQINKNVLLISSICVDQDNMVVSFKIN